IAGCWSAHAMRASSRNMSWLFEPSSAPVSTFNARTRSVPPIPVWRAAQTSPMPPLPRRKRSWNAPIRVPLVRGSTPTPSDQQPACGHQARGLGLAHGDARLQDREHLGRGLAQLLEVGAGEAEELRGAERAHRGRARLTGDRGDLAEELAALQL